MIVLYSSPYLSPLLPAQPPSPPTSHTRSISPARLYCLYCPPPQAFELRNDKSPGNTAIHVLVDCQTECDDIIVMGEAGAEGAAARRLSGGHEKTCC